MVWCWRVDAHSDAAPVVSCRHTASQRLDAREASDAPRTIEGAGTSRARSSGESANKRKSLSDATRHYPVDPSRRRDGTSNKQAWKREASCDDDLTFFKARILEWIPQSEANRSLFSGARKEHLGDNCSNLWLTEEVKRRCKEKRA